MLVPGLLCDERLWRHQVEHLGDLTDPVVADVMRGASVPEMACGARGGAGTVCPGAGLSLGGYVALEVMRAAPARVERLALLGTAA